MEYQRRAFRLASDMLKAHRAATRYFAEGLFADPALYIVLELFVRSGRRCPEPEAEEAAGVPPTTARRWVKVLGDCGLIRFEAMPEGSHVVLEESAVQAIAAWLGEIDRSSEVAG